MWPPVIGGWLVESPSQKRRHLPSGHEVIWAEPVVGRRVTSFGHPGRGEFVDVVLEKVAVVVEEQVAATVVGVTQRPDQECGHLASGDKVVGTEQVRCCVTASGDPLVCEPFDVELERIAIVVGEPAVTSSRREKEVHRVLEVSQEQEVVVGERAG